MKKYLPLRPPVYNNIEQDYQADIIYIFAWTAIVIITVFKLIHIIVIPRDWLRELSIIASVDTCAIISLLLSRQKWMRLASAVLPFTLWLITTVMTLTSGGIFAPAIAAYLPIIIMCGLLLGRRSGTAMAVLCVISTLTFVILDLRGELPANQLHSTPVLAWISFLMWGLQITIVQYVVTFYIHSSFKTISKETEERKIVEKKLRESEFNYRMVVKNRIFGVAWLSAGGMVLNANEALLNMLGYTMEEIKGVHFGDVTHPDDLAAEVALFGKMKNKEIDNYCIEKRIRCKNGKYLWTQLSRTAYYNEQTGGIDFYITIIQDIEQRKLAEEALKESEFNYRLVVQNKILGIAWASPEGNLLNASPTFCEMLGYTVEELKGVFFGDFTDPDDVARELILLEQITNKEIDNYTIEKRYRHKNGNYFWVELYLSTYRNNLTDQIEYFVGIVKNIQQRKLAEAELKLSNERLRQLSAHLQTIREEERTNIAREIHDELGQQLTALKMEASWLARELPAGDKTAQEKMGTIFSLIDDTIKTIRKISSDLRPGLLDDLGLQAALEWLSTDFERRTGIRCRLVIKLGDHDFTRELATGIFRVYQEALTNVTRHAGATQVNTTFEIKEGSVCLTVQDNGVGFDTGEAENKNTFGLIGMKERAHMFNGELKIESEKGKGTTVILSVPLPKATGNATA